MKQEQLKKTIEIIKEYNNDMFSKLRTVERVLSGKSRTRKEVKSEEVQEILILVSILLSGNIKVRYELEDWLKENKAFANMSNIKTISNNCKQDIEALKSVSFNMVEVLKSIRQREDDEKYKKSVM